jgi:hypothetical protein
LEFLSISIRMYDFCGQSKTRPLPTRPGMWPNLNQSG